MFDVRQIQFLATFLPGTSLSGVEILRVFEYNTGCQICRSLPGIYDQELIHKNNAFEGQKVAEGVGGELGKGRLRVVWRSPKENQSRPELWRVAQALEEGSPEFLLSEASTTQPAYPLEVSWDT